MMTLCCFISKIDISDCIALFGALLTGLFSFLIWRTTKKIGDRQNELQEKQNKIALNQTYRTLYLCLKKIEDLCYFFFNNIENGILAIVDEKERDFFQRQIDDFEKVKKEYENCKIDFELHLSDFPILSNRIDLLFSAMSFAYLEIKSLQLPSYFRQDYQNNSMLKTMIKILNKGRTENIIISAQNIESITNIEYRQIIDEISKLLNNSSWTISDFYEKTNEDIINHITEQLSMLTNNIDIKSDCKTIITFRDKVFKEDNIIEIVKNKCSL